MLGNNILALIVTFILALAWLRINDFLAHKGWISAQLSRKIIHAGTGPIFVLCWLLFVNTTMAPFLAALVPFAITVQFFLVGIGVMKDQAAVDAMARNGDRREILRGPLFYGIVFVIMTIVFWQRSPTGVVALMVLCGGDGLADIFGKRIPTAPLPWSKGKTWAGSAAMFFGSLIFSFAIIAVFVAAGVFPGPAGIYIPAIMVISAVCTIIESLPVKDFDNLTVPFTAVVLGLLLF